MIESQPAVVVKDDIEIEETERSGMSKTVRVVALVLGVLLTLAAVRVFVAPFDSGVTRFGCENHATYLNDLPDSNGDLDPANTDVVKRLVDSDVEWTVRRHIRSNKIGLINRDSASCIFNTNGSGADEIAIPMSLASHGNFYYFGKFMGLVLQIGLVSGFIRWFHYRFMA